MRIPLYLAALIALSLPAAACDPPIGSKWFYSDEHLVSSSSSIFVAQLKEQRQTASSFLIKPDFEPPGYALHEEQKSALGKDAIEYTFVIKELILGGRKPGDDFKVVMSRRDGNRELHPMTCQQKPIFEIDEHYLIFEGSYHPKGYIRLNGDSDKWLQRVKLLNSKRKNSSRI